MNTPINKKIVAFVNIDDDKTCSISRLNQEGIKPRVVSGLTPEQAIDVKRLAEDSYMFGRFEAIRDIKDNLPGI